MNLLASNNPLFGSFDRGIYIFGLEIYYYALCIVSGIILATVISALLMKRRNMSTDFIFTLFIFCIPTALICTRLFYCITDGMPIKYWFSFESIRNGGLSVIGGVLGGVGMGLIVCKVKKVEFFRAADCVVPTILIAQVIGRWGNFFNQEVYGSAVTNPALQWFPMAVKIGSTWHYALFFHEGVINAIGFALLFTAAWKWNKKPNGIFTFAYFAWYGTVRAIMEPLRDPSFILGDGVMWSELFAVLMILLGVGGIAVLLFLNYRKEGAIFGSKKGDPCGITEYAAASKNETPYFSKINMLGAKYPERPEEEKKPPLKERLVALKDKIISKFKKSEAPTKSDVPEENDGTKDTAQESESEKNEEKK